MNATSTSNFLRSAALTAALLAAPLSAGTISFGTGLGNETNDLTGLNVAMRDPGVYAPAPGTSQWESIQWDTATPPIDNGTEVTFLFAFALDGDPASGYLTLLVDDSAKGDINGYPLFDNLHAPPAAHCASTLPTCTLPLTVDITPYLLAGENLVAVTVAQDYGAQFGLALYGEATTSAVAPTPEPATGITFAGAALGLFLLAKARRK